MMGRGGIYVGERTIFSVQVFMIEPCSVLQVARKGAYPFVVTVFIMRFLSMPLLKWKPNSLVNMGSSS